MAAGEGNAFSHVFERNGTIVKESNSDGAATRLAGDHVTPIPPVARARRAPGSRLLGLPMLVVDDNDDNRELLTFVLAKEGADVRGVASASAALALMKRWRPRMLVSDLAMPDEDGCSLVRQVKELPFGADIHAIAITGQDSPEIREEARLAGFELHIGKPFQAEMLVMFIMGLADRLNLFDAIPPQP